MSRLDRAFARLARRRAPASTAPEIRSIVQRLDALGAMVEGLQDSVDRQARRHDDRLNELAHKLEPSELARVLSENARKRGL